jgi:uncharacterized membrane protein YukC
MKKTDKHIEDLVEKTLKAFDGIERAKPKPFLYTRLQARIEGNTGTAFKSKFLSPVFQHIAIALVILVVAFNIYTATRVFISPTASDSLQTEEQAFVEEFYPSTPTLYSLNQTTTNP